MSASRCSRLHPNDYICRERHATLALLYCTQSSRCCIAGHPEVPCGHRGHMSVLCASGLSPLRDVCCREGLGPKTREL